MSEWISVNDRLPEVSEFLASKLLYVEVKNNWSGVTNKRVTIGYYLRACAYEGWIFENKDLDVIRVISWRDIPEPPKEE